MIHPNLTPSQIIVLMSVHTRTWKELGDSRYIKNWNNIERRLIDKKLVVKQDDPEYEGYYVLHLTDLGIKVSFALQELGVEE